MQETVIRSVVAQLGVAFSTLYAAPVNRKLLFHRIRVINVTGGAITVRLCFVPKNGTATAENAIAWDESIPANEAVEFGEKLALLSEWSLQGMAGGAASVNVCFAGEES